MIPFRLSIVLIFQSLLLSAQDSVHISDSLKGRSDYYPSFAWGGTPVLSYDSDVGLRYGAVINLFDYRQESILPDYTQYVRLKLFNSTKGTSNYSLLYDSERLIPRSVFTFEASYTEDIALDFYGFNGQNTVYYQEFIDAEHTSYINKYFYTHHRKLIRIRADLQKYLTSRNFRLFTGISYNRYLTSDIDYERFDIPEKPNGFSAERITLYQKFADWEVIPGAEKEGGDILALSSGIIYDTREGKIHCKGGLWLESYFIFSPPGVSSSFFIKQITTFRHYLPLDKINALFAYRLSSQQKIAGTIPFYLLPTFYSSLENHDGPGGAFTLRGINRNRIAADSYLLANVELRKSFLAFRLLNIEWQTELLLFSDMGLITGHYGFSREGIPEPYKDLLLQSGNNRPHSTVGAGLYLIYNKNNVISVNYGISTDNQLGISGMYIGSGFLF